MIQELATSPEFFVDRRANDVSDRSPAFERRQFSNSYEELSPEALDAGPRDRRLQAASPPPFHHLRRNVVGGEVAGVSAP